MINKYQSVITKPEQLHIDDVVYLVTKITGYTNIQKVIITSKPRKAKHSDSLFIDTLVESSYSDSIYASDFSLLDYNVIPNQYNKHRVFSNYNEALKYSKE